MCATIQSIHRLPHDRDTIEAVIADEVQSFSSTRSMKELRSFSEAHWRLGFSATPFKDGDEPHNYSIKSCFGPLLGDVGTAQLMARDILAESVTHFYPVHHPALDEKLATCTNYAEFEEIGLEAMARAAAKLTQQIQSGRILILVKRLAQGDLLEKLIPGSYWVRGEDSVEKRNEVLRELREGHTNDKVVAIFSPIGFIGMDVFVHHVINATGGKSPTLTIQKLGRGLRKAVDKNLLDYHDFVFPKTSVLGNHSRERVNTVKSEGHPVVMEQPIILG
eukprot:TRINITY_DN1594_c0_g1_i1.p2 TRINITY_DN1594_c0_g1~~TRINITY_DN1594_c0_g1_i1.p2  ORF type:complete len:277 (-),score=61.98 TRINITY_DN1594_c0_g1_i1:1327-2157(-)